MTPTRKRRLFWLLAMLSGLALAVALVLFALSQNINLFYTPTQVAKGEAPKSVTFRLGGMVVKGSVQRATTDLNVSFALTDTLSTVKVHYQGILPDLFREGQGIVADGVMATDGSFTAKQVLAKHDENYMPPEVTEALSQAKRQRLAGSVQGGG